MISLLNIGIYLTFKSLFMEALHDSLEHRLPYLMMSAKDFSESFVDHKFQLVLVQFNCFNQTCLIYSFK